MQVRILPRATRKGRKMTDSTVVAIIDKAAMAANGIAGKIAEVAPIVYEAVKQRIIAEALVVIGVPLMVFVALIITIIVGVKKDWDDGLLAILVTLAFTAGVGLCVTAVIGTVNLMSLDYATAARIIKLGTGH